MRQSNFGYILRKRSYFQPDDVAIVEQATQNEHTYSELEYRSNAIARELASRGVKNGDRVCGLFRNSVEFFELFFATCKLGAAIAPFNYRLASDELAYLQENVDPIVFAYEGVFEETVAELPTEDTETVRIGETDSETRVDADDWETFYDQDSAEIKTAAGFEDTAVILHTSGSTGRPKGVPLSHKNLFFSSVSYIVDTELDSDDVTVTSSPIFHVGGLNILTLPILHTGGTVILQQQFEPVETWEIMENYDVTKMFAVPTMLNTMTDVDGWQGHELDALELVIGGGEPVPSELKKSFDEIGVPCVAAYGLTETTDGSLFLRPEQAMDKPAKCNGRTFTHVDAKVVDQNGDECSPGETGELLHRGPTVADGYLDLPEETAQTWDEDGWFYTGDIAEKDEDGFYHIHGRMDNMIVTGGENVYPSEVEEALYSHDDVNQVVVFGQPDERWGEIVKAVITTADGQPISDDELDTFLDNQLARFKHPKEIVFTDSLPRSGTGKVERQAIVERHRRN